MKAPPINQKKGKFSRQIIRDNYKKTYSIKQNIPNWAYHVHDILPHWE